MLPIYLIHWNAPDWILSSTASLIASEGEIAVNVVNNGPQDDLGLDRRVRVIRTDRNVGYAGGANIALADGFAAGADFVLIGSHDLHLEPDAIGHMLTAAERHPSVGILGPMLTTNAVGDPIDGGPLDERTMISGTCLMLRRACIEEIGGFDPLFGSYAEDDELCARARRMGWKVARVPSARGHGIGSITSDRRRHRYPNLVLLGYRSGGWPSAARMAFGHLRMAAMSAVHRDWTEARYRLAGCAIGAMKVARARRAGPLPLIRR